MFRLCVIGLMCGGFAAVAQTPAPLGKLVDVGGYRVHSYCTGSGGPTVLVVGGGFSVDWSLVQSGVSEFTTLCTYDVAGTAWSDPRPESRGPLTCRKRVSEIHRLIEAGQLPTPLVIVGLSIGGCVARLYAAQYPGDVAGMVIVDHAFSPDPDPNAGKHAPGTDSGADTPPVLIYQAPVMATVEQSAKFRQLPAKSQELHRWAMSLHPKLPEWEDAEDCLAQLKSAAAGPFPLGNLPLVVVSTNNQARGYDRLQRTLLELSHNSSQMVAGGSFHSVEIDEPEVVIAAIGRVVEAVRKH